MVNDAWIITQEKKISLLNEKQQDSSIKKVSDQWQYMNTGAHIFKDNITHKNQIIQQTHSSAKQSGDVRGNVML